MQILVVGATGATGSLVVSQLLERGIAVRAIVRSSQTLPHAIKHHEKLSLIIAPLLELSDEALREAVQDCTAVICCLGHNMTFKGLFGQPRRLVTDATRRLSTAIEDTASRQADAMPARFVLMNTTGNRDARVDAPHSVGERIVLGLLRRVLPPHGDNEQAAAWLLAQGVVSQRADAEPRPQWVVVRPDGLIDESAVSDYDISASPQRSPIFDSGQTSRINVAHFMIELATGDEAWQEWRGQMPVVYNRSLAAKD